MHCFIQLNQNRTWYKGMYLHVYIRISFCVYFNCTLSTSVYTALINSDWWNGEDFYFPTYCSFFAILNYLSVTQYHSHIHSGHNNLLHVLILYTHLGPIFSTAVSQINSLAQNGNHGFCRRCFAIFYCGSHYKISKYCNKKSTFRKLTVYPSAGTISDPVWRVMLAVSVSRFWLSVCLNPVRYYPSSTSRKISPFPVWSGLAKAPQIVSLSVQLHLNRLKGRNVFVSEKTAVKIQDIQIRIIFLQSVLLQTSSL